MAKSRGKYTYKFVNKSKDITITGSKLKNIVRYYLDSDVSFEEDDEDCIFYRIDKKTKEEKLIDDSVICDIIQQFEDEDGLNDELSENEYDITDQDIELFDKFKDNIIELMGENDSAILTVVCEDSLEHWDVFLEDGELMFGIDYEQDELFFSKFFNAKYSGIGGIAFILRVITQQKHKIKKQKGKINICLIWGFSACFIHNDVHVLDSKEVLECMEKPIETDIYCGKDGKICGFDLV